MDVFDLLKNFFVLWFIVSIAGLVLASYMLVLFAWLVLTNIKPNYKKKCLLMPFFLLRSISYKARGVKYLKRFAVAISIFVLFTGSALASIYLMNPLRFEAKVADIVEYVKYGNDPPQYRDYRAAQEAM